MKHYLSFERSGLIESLRRLWVYCKNGFYWDLEFSHSMKSERPHAFVPCTINWCHVLFTGTIKNTFSVLGTLHDCLLCFLKKKMRLTPPKLCSARLLRRVSLFGSRAEYSVGTQTEPKTKTCFGLPKPSPSPVRLKVHEG